MAHFSVFHPEALAMQLTADMHSEGVFPLPFHMPDARRGPFSAIPGYNKQLLSNISGSNHNRAPNAPTIYGAIHIGEHQGP